MIITQKRLFESSLNNYKFRSEHVIFLLINEIALKLL